MRILLPILLLAVTTLAAQVRDFPYSERFDSVIAPHLPTGWISSERRDSVNGDWVTDSTSTPRTLPNSILSKNARIEQMLATPSFDFSESDPDSLIFWERRSASHTSGLVVEYSVDGGVSYSAAGGDTFQNPGTQTFVGRLLKIPAATRGFSDVRFRWHVLGNGDSRSSAGTLRIDDVRITAIHQTDAALESVRPVPFLPVAGDPLTLVAVVANRGSRVVTSFTMIVGLMSASDSTMFADSALFIGNLEPGDSAKIEFPAGTLPAGDYRISALVRCDGDDGTANNRLAMPLIVGLPWNSVVINELMYAPAAPEPEWIEIVSLCSTAVSLKNYSFSTRHKPARCAIDTTGVTLDHDGFLVITRDRDLLLQRYPGLTSVLAAEKIASVYLTNDSDCVILWDARGAAMDSVPYRSRWGGQHGRSLERRLPDSSSGNTANWGTCIGSDSGTPGAINSITPKEHDYWLRLVNVTPPFPTAGHECIVEISVLNNGTLTLGGFVVRCVEEICSSELNPHDSLIGDVQFGGAVAPHDSQVCSFRFEKLSAGDHRIRCVISSNGDENSFNDTLALTISAGTPPGTVLINEILYNPPVGEPEWVEVVNADTVPCDLRGWSAGNHSSSRYLISDGQFILAPRKFCVIAKDTALLMAAHRGDSIACLQAAAMPTFCFSNSGDAAVITDTRGAVIDSVRYFTTWGGSDSRSLERIDIFAPSNDSANWTPAGKTARSTPGRENSHARPDTDLAAVHPVLESITGNEAHIILTLQNPGRTAAGDFPVELFLDADGDSLPDAGGMVDSVFVTQTVAPLDSAHLRLSWKNVRSGTTHLIAILHMAADQRRGNDSADISVTEPFFSSPIVINEIMYDPPPGTGEYVELLNISRNDVDLRGWRMTDNPASGQSDKRIITNRTHILAAGGYCIIAPDSGAVNFFSVDSVPSGMIISPGIFSLGNGGDNLVLSDPSGLTIDSLRYDPSWHNPALTDVSGKSLERINPSLPATDRMNWSTSADPGGGTPLRRNSLYMPVPTTSGGLEFTPNPFSPDGDGMDDIVMIRYSLGSSSALLRARIYDCLGREVRVLCSGRPTGSSGELIWDGTDDRGNRVRIGIYIILLEATGEGGVTIESQKGLVVVATRL
jgi:hypothetical protein